MSGLTYCSASGCACTTPTPDPASPCGWLWPSGAPCLFPANKHPDHDGIPTRCKECRHPIEADR